MSHQSPCFLAAIRKKTLSMIAGHQANLRMFGLSEIVENRGSRTGTQVILGLTRYYLEEFTFRFNRRTSTSRGQLFRRLLEQAVATNPVTENDILHGYPWKPEKQAKNQE